MKRDTALELTLSEPDDAVRITAAFPQAEESGGKLIFPNASDQDCAELMAFLAAQRISVQRLERHESCLEDLFMEVIGK